jgi:hypothetical protein
MVIKLERAGGRTTPVVAADANGGADTHRVQCGWLHTMHFLRMNIFSDVLQAEQ